MNGMNEINAEDYSDPLTLATDIYLKKISVPVRVQFGSAALIIKDLDQAGSLVSSCLFATDPIWRRRDGRAGMGLNEEVSDGKA